MNKFQATRMAAAGVICVVVAVAISPIVRNLFPALHMAPGTHRVSQLAVMAGLLIGLSLEAGRRNRGDDLPFAPIGTLIILAGVYITGPMLTYANHVPLPAWAGEVYIISLMAILAFLLGAGATALAGKFAGKRFGWL